MGEGEEVYDIGPRRRRPRREKFEKGLDGSRQLNLEPRRLSRADKVAWNAAYGFAFNRWLRRDELWEFFAEAQLAVARLLRRRPRAPDSWIYTVAEQAVLKFWQTSNLIYIKPTTRARWVDQGRLFNDFERHSYQTIFDSSDAPHESVMRDHPQWARDQREDAPWGNYQQMILKHSEIDHECMEQTSSFRLLLTMCRDDTDTLVLAARWDKGVGLNAGTLLHLDVIASSVGINVQEVKTRLKEIERRYYRETGQKLKPGPMPMGTRPKVKKKAA
ncbi:hypothetical protein [Lacipirellula sp.]|uniref:hypothetical protein n=1 Tax=Lacipirellula sp. TaxID=2691419 RepID=UPI003D10C4D1